MNATPLAAWMQAEGKNLRDVADALDVTRASVCHWKNGAKMPQGANLVRLMALTGLSSDHFIPVRFTRPAKRRKVS